MPEEMLIQYKKCFNTDKTVALCGREACKTLIRMCEEFTGKTKIFGNIETGFMNIENIHKLFDVYS